MIPVKTTPEEHEARVQRIVEVFFSASLSQYGSGLEWYNHAHELAMFISDGNARKGAGVIAALSANKSWSENSKLALRAFSNGHLSGHFQDALTKTIRIMSGEDPETVLPMHAKTGNFFLCIANPRHPSAIVIDRHAHDVAVGEAYGNRDRGLSSKGRYNALARAYRDAADRVKELPLHVQAITWTVQVDKLSAERGYSY